MSQCSHLAGSCEWSAFHAICLILSPGENEQEGDEAIQASVEGMQRVIDLARVLRERHSKPLKQPLQRLTVVHPNPAFLADLTGPLRGYIMAEVNVVELEACDDPARFRDVRAQPEWQVLCPVTTLVDDVSFPELQVGALGMCTLRLAGRAVLFGIVFRLGMPCSFADAEAGSVPCWYVARVSHFSVGSIFS